MKRSFPWDEQVGASYNSSFQAGAEKTSSPPDGLLSATTLANIGGENGKTCVHKASDKVSSLSDLNFSEILFLADAAWENSSRILPDNNDGLKSPQFHGDLQGTSYIPCCSKENSQDTLPMRDNAIRAESRQIASMQINIEEKDPWGEEENVPAKKLDNNGTPPNKELCNLVTELAAVSTPFKENHDPDNGSNHDVDLTKTTQQKRRRRKHRPKIIIEGKPKRTRKPATPEAFQSKENPTVKRNYVRRKGSNKTSTPPTEVTGELTKENMPESAKMTCRRSLNFERVARDESSLGRENASAHLAKEIGVVVQETNVGLVHDLNTSTKRASNNYIVISDDSESPGTSPLRRNPLRAKPKEKPTAKRRRARRKGLKNPAEVYRERMEVGEMDKKERQVEVSWIPTTPAKPILTKPVPICMPEEQNRQPGHQYASEAIACFEFSAGAVPATDDSVPTATLTKTADENGKTCVHGASDNVSSWGNLRFSELLFLAEAASKNSSGMLPENNDGLKNPFIPSLNSQFNGDLQGSSYIPCCSKQNSRDTLHTPDNAIRAESRQIASMQINIEEKDPWGEEENVPAKKLDNNETPQNKELCNLVTELAAVSTPLKENHDPDNGSSHDIGVYVQETNVGLAYDFQISMKQASNNYMSLSEDKQAPSTAPSKSNPPEAKAKENATGKRQYVRRKRLNKSTTPPTKMTAALTVPKMRGSTKMSWRSSASRKNLNENISKDNNSVKQVLSSYMSLPEDTQAPSTSPVKSNPPAAKKNEKATGKRRFVRRKGMNKSSTPPSEMTAELTEPVMPESTKMAHRRSLNFDVDARDESSAGRQSLHVHNSKENSVVAEETHVGLAYSQSTPMKQALYSFMSLPEDKQAPSTSLTKSNHPGAKLNANSVEDKSKRNDQATAHGGHEKSAKLLLKSAGQSNSNGSDVSNSQTSMKRLQMGGSKRKHSGNTEPTDTSSMNENGAHYNEFPSFQSKFRVQFPNIQKKRRSDKGKSSNTSITSSVTTIKEVELTCPQEVAQTLPYASSSSSWSFGSEYITARVPTINEATESVIDDPQAFEDFILNLRRVAKISSFPTKICDCASLTRIRNLGTEPNYSVNQLCISERQQHQNFALGNYHLPLGNSSLDTVSEERLQILRNVKALSEQFTQLDINKEA